MSGKFTGWHMLAMMVAFFGVVIGVNVTMARIAIGSFGGVVVENSYVASQEFNGWLASARGQEGLGWEVASTLGADRRLSVSVSGAPDPLAVSGTLRHPLGRLPDTAIAFTRTGPGEYVSTVPVAEQRWILRLELASGRDRWRSEGELQ
jgi:nitrogen fixation protein FixH